MKLPFSLPQFADFFSDESVRDAENHLSDGRVGSLDEIEKKLWVCKYEEGAQLYEIEIQLVGKKVKDFACDCNQSEKDCRHAYYALEELNGRFDSEIETKTKKAEDKKKNTPSKPQTVRNIVQNAETEELRKFVIDLCSSNKNFEMAVRARFGLDATGQDIENTSKEIFAKLLAKARTAYGDINAKGWEQLITFLDGIKFKIENCFQNQNFANALEFWYCYTNFILRLHRNDWSVGKKLDKRRQFSTDFLATIHPLIVAPELKEKLHKYLLVLAESYVKLEESQPIIQYAFKEKIFTEANTLELLFSIREALTKSSLYYEEQFYLELLEISFLHKLGRYEEARKILKIKKRQSTLFLTVINNTIESEDFTESKFLIEEGKLRYTEPENLFALMNFEFKIAEKQNDTAEIKRLAQKLLLMSNSKSYLDILIKEGISDSEFEVIKKQYEAKSSDSESRKILGYIYFKKENYDDILRLIEKTNDLELFGEYGVKMNENNSDALKNRILPLLIKYLNASAGSMPVERVYNMLHELKHNKGESLVKFLAKQITTEFKNRHYLKSRLFDFLTREEIYA